MKKIFLQERKRGLEERKEEREGESQGSRGSGDMESSQGCEKERGYQVGESSGRQNGRVEII